MTLHDPLRELLCTRPGELLLVQVRELVPDDPQATREAQPREVVSPEEDADGCREAG